jgi:HK97 family phage major capsid protein
MALDTVTSVLAGLRSDDATLRLIRDKAIATSAVGKIRPPANLTQPSVRGVSTARLTAAAVAEGSTKTIASGIATAYSYQVYPVAIIVPVSNMLYQSGPDIQKSIIAALVEGVAVGVDNEIINNPNSVFTLGVKAAAVAAGNTVTSGPYLYNDLSTAFDQVQSTYFTVDGVIGRRAEMGALRLAVPSGQTMFAPLFTPTNESAPATIFGADAEFVDGRVLPKTASTGETRFVVGDWTQLEWGTWGGMKIDVFDQGSAGAFNAITQNITLVRAEMYIGYTVVNNAAFSVVNEA